MTFSSSFFAPGSLKPGSASPLTGSADGAPPQSSRSAAPSEVASEGAEARATGIDQGASGSPIATTTSRDAPSLAQLSPGEIFSSQTQKDIQSSPGPSTAGDIHDIEMANSADPGASSPIGAYKKPAAAKKKKGTASTVRAPRRSRGGGARRGGGRSGKSKKAATSAPSAELSSDPLGPDDEDGGGADDSDEDPGPYCICRGPDNHRFMIACDRCEDWFHGDCIGMDKWTGENLVQKYICPRCGENGRYRTRYRKMCALEACERPARLYGGPGSTKSPGRPRGVDDDEDSASVFCSDEHAQAWWEQLLLTLPKGARGANATVSADEMTQEMFMALLDHAQGKGASGPWRLGQEPFGVQSDFWASVSHAEALTVEERGFLEQSALERTRLGEETVLCKKMLQLIEMSLARREAAIAAGKATKDLCGYDYRLDTVGNLHSFVPFATSPEGEAAFASGRLDAPPARSANAEGAADEENTDSALRGMCTRKKCKTHLSWNLILTKAVRRQMRELSTQAGDKLEAEERVRASAAARYRRKLSEKNWVKVVESGESDEDAMEED